MPCSRTQHGLTRVGLEPPTSGSGVRGINIESGNAMVMHQSLEIPVPMGPAIEGAWRGLTAVH